MKGERNKMSDVHWNRRWIGVSRRNNRRNDDTGRKRETIDSIESTTMDGLRKFDGGKYSADELPHPVT